MIMDLLDFSSEALYFDEPVSPDVEALLLDAAQCYGEPSAERNLLLAYFLEPEHLTVLVALYRYFYYQHRYREALITADRAIGIAAQRLDLPASWRELSESNLEPSALNSMSLTRFLLFALKGSSYLLLRLGEPAEALERLETLAAIDTRDRLGIQDLLQLARATVAESAGATADDQAPSGPSAG
jgi:tetratricopeptide (TPR) repeat protein